MPLCDIQTNIDNGDISKEFVLQLGQIISHHTSGKAATVRVQAGVRMFMGAGPASAPLMLIQLHGGFTDGDTNKQICEALIQCSTKELGIREDRISLVFHYLPPTHVGWSGGRLVADVLPETRLKQVMGGADS
ncbi:macrophage migration inhibitory factor-like [Patiria miniata]|uniref:Macrophage migration inhibitory factor n=1 Tax=Patiria miniata TaxID=46514 RepID=A0A913Z4R1_PATMI|nr:macrophage migration inhibitory factor-like [Patiria miniata]